MTEAMEQRRVQLPDDAVESGRQLFDKLGKGDPTTRPAYLPLISRVVSRVAGVALRELTSDPAHWANAVMRTADLLDLDGIAVGVDDTLLAEALGCDVSWENDRPSVAGLAATLAEGPEQRGRLRNAIDVISRVFPIVRAQRGCAGLLTGPATLAVQLFGTEGRDRAGDVRTVIVRLVEFLCKERPDLVCLLEGPALLWDGTVPLSCRRTYNTIHNITSYYSVPLAVAVVGYEVAHLAMVTGLGCEILIAGPARDGSLPSAEAILDTGIACQSIGLPLPMSDHSQLGVLLQSALRARNAGRLRSFFMTAFEPETADLDLAALQRIVPEIRSAFG